ncbi:MULTISPECIES: hypothetical protein [Polaribacter]|uniref:Exosortase n=1 Tax=Polaribacter marinaquae TaxID=1642819 RepID=A0ABZ2TNN7_9FLAO
MNLFFYNNRKKIRAFSILLLLLGAILAFLNWGIEPEETIAGFLVGLGFGILLLSFNLKKE